MYLTILWPTSRFGKANFLSNNPLGTNKMEKGERKETKQEEIRYRGKKKKRARRSFPDNITPVLKLAKRELMTKRVKVWRRKRNPGHQNKYWAKRPLRGPHTPLDNAHYLPEWRPLPVSKESGRNVHKPKLVRCDSPSAGVRRVRRKIQHRLVMG